MADLALVNRLDIRTPEGITFSKPLAGIPSRCVAWLVDTLARITCTVLISMALGWIVPVLPEFGAIVQLLIYVILGFGYNVGFEWFWHGQTLGKRLLRLRVMDAQGLRLQFHQIVLRNLIRPIDGMPAGYGVGLIAILLNRRNQRLGDLAGNTVVVRAPRLEEPDVEQVVGGKYNSFRDYPHLEARLRQRVTPEETSLLLQALLRRDQLDANARVVLYADMAAHFREYASFPEEATRGLTDEQYLRNVADSLFRRGSGARG